MNNIFRLLCFILLLMFSVPSISFSYDDKITHPHITTKAINVSTLNHFLQEYFNLEGYNSKFGHDTRLNEKSVIELVQEGSELEDKPSCRAANHFHNPIATGTTWDEGKLTDPSLLISIVACNTFFPEYPYENKMTVLVGPS